MPGRIVIQAGQFGASRSDYGREGTGGHRVRVWGHTGRSLLVTGLIVRVYTKRTPQRRERNEGEIF
jgi:hypothetical protein